MSIRFQQLLQATGVTVTEWVVLAQAMQSLVRLHQLKDIPNA